MAETPVYYQITATQDLIAWAAQWLAEAQWHSPYAAELDLLWYTMCRYVVRLPHKGQDATQQASDARKALHLLTQMVARLEQTPACTGKTPPACPTIRYDQLSESSRDWVRREVEPGTRFYYWMTDRTVQRHRAHEWPAFEGQVQAELASGAVRRVVLPEELTHGH